MSGNAMLLLCGMVNNLGHEHDANGIARRLPQMATDFSRTPCAEPGA